MKKALALLFAFLIIFSTKIFVLAEGNDMQFELSDDGTYYYFIKADADTKNLIIPETYNGLPVCAFADHTVNDPITSDTWSEPILECKDVIETITLTDNIYIFRLQTYPMTYEKLKFNKYEKGLYLGTADNPYYALVSMEKSDELSSDLVVHEDTEIIGGYVAESAVLKNITLSDSIKYIHPNAFFALTYFPEHDKCQLNYNEYEGGYYIGSATNPYYALAKASDVAEFKIHENTKVIMPKAFNRSTAESITIPETVITVSEDAFYGCDSLKTINLEAESIENLKFCKLPDNITLNWNYGNNTVEEEESVNTSAEDNASNPESGISTIDNAENDGKGNMILIIAVIAGVIVGGGLALYKSKKKK